MQNCDLWYKIWLIVLLLLHKVILQQSFLIIVVNDGTLNVEIQLGFICCNVRNADGFNKAISDSKK